MSEVVVQMPSVKTGGFISYVGPGWSESEGIVSSVLVDGITLTSQILPTAKIISEMRAFLSNHSSIESVWLEDLGTEVNVLIMTKDVRNSTLDPIFDAKMALLNHYPYVKFNFELNPVDFEKKLCYNQIQRIV